jgi:hypothetical protein
MNDESIESARKVWCVEFRVERQDGRTRPMRSRRLTYSQAFRELERFKAMGYADAHLVEVRPAAGAVELLAVSDGEGEQGDDA